MRHEVLGPSRLEGQPRRLMTDKLRDFLQLEQQQVLIGTFSVKYL